MTWERTRDIAGAVWAIFLPLWFLNFVAFIIVSFFVGGAFFYGDVQDGQYFLAFRGNHQISPLQPVSKEVYYYSVYHWYSITALAFIFGPAFLVWALAGSICRSRMKAVEVRVTPAGIDLDGQPVSVAAAVEGLKEALKIDRDRRPRVKINNDYEASKAPDHAVALQMALREQGVLVEQTLPRGKEPPEA